MQEMTDRNALNLKEAGFTKSNADSEKDFFNKYFKVVTDCGNHYLPCFASEYSSMDGTKKIKYDTSITDVYCVVLASGTAICLNSIGENEVDTEGDKVAGFWAGNVTLDVNGTKGPNIGGRDRFSFRYYSDGSIDVHRENCNLSDKSCMKDLREKRFQNCCLKGTGAPVGDDCIGKLINDNWEMNY